MIHKIIKSNKGFTVDRALLMMLVVMNILECAGLFALLMWMNHTAIYRLGG